jgi:hypothetical protein
MLRQKSLRSSVDSWIRSTAPRRWRDGSDVGPDFSLSPPPVPADGYQGRSGHATRPDAGQPIGD